MTHEIGKYTDKRGREWECFRDASYYDLWCIRLAGERGFNSPLSFHFETLAAAESFAHALMRSR